MGDDCQFGLYFLSVPLSKHCASRIVALFVSPSLKPLRLFKIHSTKWRFWSGCLVSSSPPLTSQLDLGRY